MPEHDRAASRRFLGARPAMPQTQGFHNLFYDGRLYNPTPDRFKVAGEHR